VKNLLHPLQAGNRTAASEERWEFKWRVRRKNNRMDRKLKPLNPLVPLSELKAFIGKVLAVPKSEIDRREAELQKRKATKE